jgi:glycosyltransferase involved in cell wall biosynthesis
MPQNTKSNLLLISAIPPQPQNSGGATRIQNTITELSKYYNVDFITFDESEIKIQPKNFSLFFTKFIPYWFTPWYNQKLISKIGDIVTQKHYDIIQVEFSQLLYLIKYLPKNTKKVFTAHDISSISFYRRVPEGNPSILKRIIRYLFFLQIYFYEKKYLPKFDTIISVSQKDQQTLKKYLPHKNIICLENGIAKINFLKKTPSKIIKLGYIGSFEHTPNLNAVKYFYHQIAPLLDKEKINYEFYLAGKNDPEFIKINFPKIINLGQVKNTLDFYQKIDCLITPIFSGSGSRIKILESLSFGIPVISSSIGAEGININSDYLQIATTPSEYVQSIQNIYQLNNDQLLPQLTPLLWKNIFNKYQKLI